MIKFQNKPYLFNIKLTAIWAVSESGLGGLIHALKLPFSGLFLGSFAVLIITYLAYISPNKFNAILKATFLVVLIKVTASPHSPPMAYIAVLFQGVLGACIYAAFGVNKFSTTMFGAIALLESAFQKILTLTIIFGIGLWESIKEFFNGIQDKLNMDWISDLPWVFLGLYALLYLVIGIVIGLIAIRLPNRVYENAKTINSSEIKFNDNGLSKRKHKKRRIYLIGFLLLFSVLVFVFSGSLNSALYIVLRTMGAIIFFLFIFNPIFKILIQKWAKKKKKSQNETLNNIIELMPSIRRNVTAANSLSLNEKNIWKRAKSFTINWLSLSLYYDFDDNA
ncbi:hypothetical protein [Winogradskyella vincentii]|uniref:Uncharacterized protein n=1 Tax=Winogradskyella vincentii TaxID=2877122 RepID=A0ABS7Y2S5_9FLAO|nr:hypothetical protein [Winogradskyella vincentii]MCA0154240.1 hypothetical protein [Winogradskyella vincentii]